MGLGGEVFCAGVGCGYCGLVLLCGLDGCVGGDEVGASGVEFGAAVAGAAQLE